MAKQALDRDDIVSYLIQRVDRRDLDGEQFNHLLQELGVEPPSESARIGIPEAELPEDRKGAGIE
jgi:hypothetical protein